MVYERVIQRINQKLTMFPFLKTFIAVQTIWTICNLKKLY